MAENQYVIFKLGNEKYCADISNVSSISEQTEVTKVPNSPEHIEGVINLRGQVIPVVNLKGKFNLEDGDVDQRDKRIIIVHHEMMDIGFIVDEANQVLKIDDEDIDPTPAIIATKEREYIIGMGKVEGEIIILLDLVKILTDTEVDALSHIEM